jgi:hypothetical protein
MICESVRIKRFLACCAGTLIGITVLCANSLMAAPLQMGPPSGCGCHLAALRGAPAVGTTLNGAKVKTSAAPRSPIYELAYLKISPNGSKITGTLYHVASESCVLSIGSGALTLDRTGNGTLTLTAPSLAGLTDQGDMACSVLFGGQTSLTETFHAIFADNQIQLAGDENYFPPGGTGTALVPVGGACVPQ